MSEKEENDSHAFYHPQKIKANLGRLKKPLISLLVISMIVSVVYASYWIYSNVITVSVSDYTLTISWTTNGLEVYITGQLLDDASQPVVGGSVVIYRTDNAGVILETIATATTDASGNYAHTWIAPTEGTYYFKSGYEVT